MMMMVIMMATTMIMNIDRGSNVDHFHPYGFCVHFTKMKSFDFDGYYRTFSIPENIFLGKSITIIYF